jgi:hypothetical protein
MTKILQEDSLVKLFLILNDYSTLQYICCDRSQQNAVKS